MNVNTTKTFTIHNQASDELFTFDGIVIRKQYKNNSVVRLSNAFNYGNNANPLCEVAAGDTIDVKRIVVVSMV